MCCLSALWKDVINRKTNTGVQKCASENKHGKHRESITLKEIRGGACWTQACTDLSNFDLKALVPRSIQKRSLRPAQKYLVAAAAAVVVEAE